MSTAELLQVYRNLYRTALQAVRYSHPARYQIRDILRQAFRDEKAEHFDAQKIQNTVQFLCRARDYTGLEHRILRNILHTSFHRSSNSKPERVPPWLRSNDNVSRELRTTTYSHFDATLAMFNLSANLCLRALRTGRRTSQFSYRPNVPRDIKKREPNASEGQ